MHYIVSKITQYIASVSQILAIIVIFIGIVKSLVIFIKDSMFKMSAIEAVKESRIELGHSFSLGLGFLIGASILQTMLAPTWNDIGKLTAIIVLRTFLNYFLIRETKINFLSKKNNVVPDINKK